MNLSRRSRSIPNHSRCIVLTNTLKYSSAACRTANCGQQLEGYNLSICLVAPRIVESGVFGGSPLHSSWEEWLPGARLAGPVNGHSCMSSGCGGGDGRCLGCIEMFHSITKIITSRRMPHLNMSLVRVPEAEEHSLPYFGQISL